MIPATFDYVAPETLDETLDLLQRHSDAKLMAGGQSLLPLMKLRLAAPSLVIDLGRVPGLAYIREDDRMVKVGALTTHAEIERSPIIGRHFAVLAQAAGAIGGLQVRNRGTLGGSLAHADPAADYPAAVLALEAVIHVRGPAGARAVPADGFFTGLFQTALQPGEVITEVQITIPPKVTGSAYLKMKHPASGFAVVGAAAVVCVGPDGREQRVRLAFTGVASRAYRAKAVEAGLRGKTIDEVTVAEALGQATEGADMLEDLFADAEYRAHLARVYGKRALLAATQT